MNYFLFYVGRKMKKVKHANGDTLYYVNGTSKRKHGMPSQKFISSEAGSFCHSFSPKCDSRNLCFALTNLYIVYSTNKRYTYLHYDGRTGK